MEDPKVFSITIVSILFLVGLIILLFGVIRYSSTKGYKRIEGIMLIKKGFRIDHGKPNVRYEVEGYTYTYTSPIGQSFGIRHGKKVPVLYDPNNPANAVIDTFIQRGGRRVLGGIIIIFCCIISMMFILI